MAAALSPPFRLNTGTSELLGNPGLVLSKLQDGCRILETMNPSIAFSPIVAPPLLLELIASGSASERVHEFASALRRPQVFFGAAEMLVPGKLFDVIQRAAVFARKSGEFGDATGPASVARAANVPELVVDPLHVHAECGRRHLAPVTGRHRKPSDLAIPSEELL